MGADINLVSEMIALGINTGKTPVYVLKVVEDILKHIHRCGRCASHEKSQDEQSHWIRTWHFQPLERILYDLNKGHTNPHTHLLISWDAKNMENRHALIFR